jgi:hypothetical protein
MYSVRYPVKSRSAAAVVRPGCPVRPPLRSSATSRGGSPSERSAVRAASLCPDRGRLRRLRGERAHGVRVPGRVGVVRDPRQVELAVSGTTPRGHSRQPEPPRRGDRLRPGASSCLNARRLVERAFPTMHSSSLVSISPESASSGHSSACGVATATPRARSAPPSSGRASTARRERSPAARVTRRENS